MKLAPLTITGPRATVDLLPPGQGGWAWRCTACRRTAGIPAGGRHLNPDLPANPFTNGRVNGLWGTAEGHCRRSATAHATRICPGPDSTTWRPTPTSHDTKERR